MEVPVLAGGAVLIYFGWKVLDSLLRIPYIRNLSQKYILVTGCDSGFGLGVAQKLDKLGCHVFAACLTEEGEQAVKVGASNRLKTVRMDVTNDESVTGALDFVRSSLPPSTGLWAILNNAGVIGPTGPLEWLSMKDYNRCMGINAFGQIRVIQKFLPLVKKARGRIVNKSSVVGRFSMPYFSAYNASKFAVEGYSDCLRRELHQFGVTVHLVEPGPVKTNIVDGVPAWIRQAWHQTTPELREEYGEEFLNSLTGFLQGRSEVMSPDPSEVVDADVHALISRFPRSRYAVGLECRALLVIQSLPEFVADAIGRLMTPKHSIAALNRGK